MPTYRQRLDARIQSRIRRVESGCWEWTGRLDRGGYGVIGLYKDGGQLIRGAHRVSYELYVNEIPEGKQIDHLCRVRSCINPEHLEPVTSKENTMRSSIAPATINSRKTHCVNGHEFTEENVYTCKEGHRRCKSCRRERSNAHYARKTARKLQKSAA